MVQYARTDTHYLLYIYDCMRGQLLDLSHGQPGLLQSVWNKSKDISLKVGTSSHLMPPEDKTLLHQPPPTSSTLSFITLIFSQFHAPISPADSRHNSPTCLVFNAEIYEAHIHGGVVSGAAEAAEEDF